MGPTHRGVLAVAFLTFAGGSVPASRGMDASDLRSFESRGTPSARPRLTLTFVDYALRSAEIVDAFQAETAALVAAMGVDVDVRTLYPGAALDVGAITLIVMDGEAPSRQMRGVMGAVQRQGALPVLWIYSANVAAGSRLGWKARDRWSADDRDAFVRAMARVAVHEVVHLVCPWRAHDRRGLMAGVMDRSTLTSSRLPFTSDLRRDFGLGVDALRGASFPLAEAGRGRR
jgi:hypothetical protein